MREILFRAKRIDNGEWIEGLPSRQSDGVIREIERLNFDKLVNGVAAIEYIEVKEETICQYTGLPDKNGRKIFEGDIVKLPKCENDIAVFGLRGCNYFLKGKRSNYELGSCNSECFEVIGNIFDNPDLIGEQP